MDITANWREESEFPAHIRTREAKLAAGELKRFEQRLDLPPGEYAVELEHNTFFAWKREGVLDEEWKSFDGLEINGVAGRLEFKRLPGSTCYRALRHFTVKPGEGTVKVALRVPQTRTLRTWLQGPVLATKGTHYYNPAGIQGGELLLANGVPFRVPAINFRFVPAWPISYDTADSLLKDMWPPLVQNPVLTGVYRGGLLENAAGKTFDCGGAAPAAVHFLGMIHNMDIANGSWYCPRGDNGYSHFVGDRAGDIILHWQDGDSTVVPLIIGFNIWYGQPWDILWQYKPAPGAAMENFDAEIFGGDPEPRNDIERAVQLVDGIRLMGCASTNARFVFSVTTDGRPLRAIEVRGTPEMHDYPLISGITLECAGSAEKLDPLPSITPEPPNLRMVDLKAIKNGEYLPPVKRLMRHLYTFTEQLPVPESAEVPAGYFGPHYRFEGPPEALYAATYLYRNGPECSSFIADTGMGCPSPVSHNKVLAQYVFGTGIWRTCQSHYGDLQTFLERYQTRAPGNLPGRGGGWSRGIGELLREACAFGYDKFAESYVDFLDRALFQFATPPHWNRVVGSNYARQSRKVGDVIEEGNRENDGHGIIMWGRYMAWHSTGHSPEWNRRRWKATEASVEWLQWQLDTDTLFPGARKDVLFTESECAHGGYDIYSTFNCLHGLKLAIRMARELGENNAVARWEALYRRLRSGILAELVDDSEFGPIWHTDPHCDWQDHAHKLVPIQLATDGETYTPLEDYAAGEETDRRFLEISRNTWRWLMREKQYNLLRMYGYGQGLMTQAALLLDEMADAERFLSMMVRYCYLPGFAGWASPEGIIVHRSGGYYLPVNAYGGQDSHLADSTKAVRLTLGVDDNDPGHLRLVPRFPAGWNSMSIDRFPAVIDGGRKFISYAYRRSDDGQRFEFKTDDAVRRVSLRLGPIPEGKTISAACFNALPVEFHCIHSGDSRWLWIRNLNGQGAIEVTFN